jgi:hypothetical protein
VKARLNVSIERLETRALLAHVGLDLNFGDVGDVGTGGDVLVSDVAGGKIIAATG